MNEDQGDELIEVMRLILKSLEAIGWSLNSK